MATFASSVLADDIIVGRTMGMMYRLDFGEPVSGELRLEYGDDISSELSRIESIFSLYRSDSELSRWNADTTLESMKVSDDLFTLALQASRLWRASNGAFDPTIRPLLKVWNFDSPSLDWKPPESAHIEAALQHVGMDRIELDAEKQTLRKLQFGVELDLNALVEGWAIDRVVKLLREKKQGHFLFQLGGEFYASGCTRAGKPWTIGIEDPGNPDRLVGMIDIQNRSLSISGNYRSGRTSDGKWYSHLLDPRTGYPSRNVPSLVAVTADSAFEADGWATTLMIGEQGDAVELADRQSLAAWFVASTDGKTTTQSSAEGKGVFVKTKPTQKSATPEATPRSGWLCGVPVFFLSCLVVWRLCRRLMRAN